MQTKKAFWKLGIDCQDVYEVRHLQVTLEADVP